ncbi:MAG: TraB/GumN family protein [Desulfofustis sp.]|nr:TraB/GumN family protein [Desulfofustis sp.]MBT8354972.1 TraB/GumN family protein [Desulfofustis sp.]NNK57383.1 TraB/GumN family protein [Desulfofustis sp.]RZW26854.1 MAG: TraB/GumN family protein [Desulfobulbaceae bacterium]
MNSISSEQRDTAIQAPGTDNYPADVQFIEQGKRMVILVGTAHVSQQSVDLVQQVIEQERPDRVCIELDDKRFQALSDENRWQKLDLKAVIKNRQLSTLMVSMMMAGYQKKLGDNLGVSPGAELLAAARSAEGLGIPIHLCDRDIRITLRRAWKSNSLFRKAYLLSSLIAGMFYSEEIDEEKLEELKKQDVLTELMAEMSDSLPEMKKVLIDERDIYMAEQIKRTAGQRLVVVVGAGHLEGIKKQLLNDQSADLGALTTIPPVSRMWKTLGWLIPAIIIGSIGLIAISKGYATAGDNIVYWILANGIPASIGSALALAHPLTIFGAFAAAPVTSLTPVIGAGYVTAFIQVMTRPPVVREFETVGEDMATLFGWWRNKLLRVFLVFILTGIGSAIGTYVGGYEIIKTLMS